MAAPSATARGTPEGIALYTGFASKITLGADATIELWEKGVTPPGVDGGDPIDTTTHHNTAWRTFRPRTLKTLTPCSCKAAYDPDILEELTSRVNYEDTITVTYADGTTDAFFGYLQKVEFDEMVEGEPPSGTFTFQPTNWDTTSNAEQGRTLTEVAGT